MNLFFFVSMCLWVSHRFFHTDASAYEARMSSFGSWNVRNRSILFVDDCITTGTTARLCYQALVGMGNHVDGLIWVSAGG